MVVYNEPQNQVTFAGDTQEDVGGAVEANSAAPQSSGGLTNLQTQSDGALDISSTLQIILNNQTALMSNQKIMYENQMQLVKSVYDVRQSMFEMLKKLTDNPKDGNSAQQAKRPQTTLSSFAKIVDLNTLEGFENKITEDENYRNDLLGDLVAAVGKNHTDMSHANMALKLGRKIFHDGFWKETAWTGGKQRLPDGQPLKFAFSRHIVFISFFKECIREICGTTISDSNLVLYVKGRTKNAQYERKTNRETSSRKRAAAEMDADEDLPLDGDHVNP